MKHEESFDNFFKLDNDALLTLQKVQNNEPKHQKKTEIKKQLLLPAKLSFMELLKKDFFYFVRLGTTGADELSNWT
jgi:hypothetical protein